MSIATNLCVRWMIEQDMDAVMEIETSSFDHPWSYEQFRKLRRTQHGTTALVATDAVGYIVGYIVFTHAYSHLTIVNLATSWDSRRNGVATRLVDFAKKRLSKQRNRIDALVSDRNKIGHLFFQSQGFLAVQVLHHEYEENGDDAYLFEFCHGPAEAKARQR